jgi:adiponectin receptor
MITRLYNPSSFPPSKPNRESEIEEEPEYLFPNKTPAAAMRRQQSYAVKREVRELRRARSVSLSALGERKGMTTGPGMGPGAEMRRTKSRDDGTVWKVVLTDSEGEDEDGRAGGRAGKSIDNALNLEVGEEEEGEELEVEIEEVAALDVGPTVHEALQKSENGTKLIVFDDLPWWMRNNEYVTGGYRRVPFSPSFCIEAATDRRSDSTGSSRLMPRRVL